jgi:hypothetical protein
MLTPDEHAPLLDNLDVDDITQRVMLYDVPSHMIASRVAARPVNERRAFNSGYLH